MALSNRAKGRLAATGLWVAVGVVALLGWIYAQQPVQPLFHPANWARMLGLPGY